MLAVRASSPAEPPIRERFMIGRRPYISQRSCPDPAWSPRRAGSDPEPPIRERFDDREAPSRNILRGAVPLGMTLRRAGSDPESGASHQGALRGQEAPI